MSTISEDVESDFYSSDITAIKPLEIAKLETGINGSINNKPLPVINENKSRYSCLKKVFAVFFSQIGLLFAIILYLFIGCILFHYLERGPQQENLTKGIEELKETVTGITNSGLTKNENVSRSVPRSRNEQQSLLYSKIAMHCINLQVASVISELNKVYNEPTALENRIVLFNNLHENMSILSIQGEYTQISEIVRTIMQLNVNRQIAEFNYLLKSHQAQMGLINEGMPGIRLENVIMSVYKAVLLGWRPNNARLSKNISASGAAVSRNKVEGGAHIGTTKLLQKTETPLTDPWAYSGSLFFSITVITTIGYGNIVPHTNLGKIGTVIYGLFGIPMMLLFLANLGSLMADLFRIAYQNAVTCSQKCKDRNKPKLEKPPNHTQQRRKTTAPIEQLIHIQNRAKSEGQIENLPSLDDIVEISSPTTAASPNLRPKPGRNKKKSSAFTIQQLVQNVTLPGVSDSLFVSLAGTHSVFAKALRVRQQSRVVHVPIWLTLVIFFVYLFSGAAVFAHWEDWTYINSIYFVFITISTIGFGDIIPGMTDNDFSRQTQTFIFATTYLLVGLALVCMCFDLMQNELKQKMAHLAKRIGLTENS